MASRRGWRAAACAAGLFACGLAADAAWRGGMWGSLAGAVLAAGWLGALTWWLAAGRERPPPRGDEPAPGHLADRLVLDAAPTAMVAIEGGHVRALNRAARRLFGTDERVLPPPPGLLCHQGQYLRHEGRQYRIDRVRIGGAAAARTVAALIDIEQEERVAEARASAEMIHVLGHELLNGLAPIASLAESGEAALDRPSPDPALLREILGTLARRVEGLLRFTEGYRRLARLPAPQRSRVSLSGMADDLGRLFAGRWPGLSLTVRVEEGREWPLDRDQLDQALWAMLHNAAEAAAGGDDRCAWVMLTVRIEGNAMIAEVEDSGAGVAPADAVRIFRPFHTTKPDGTGIGLSLARQVALAHGGSLTLVAPRPARFRLAIPLPPA